MLPGSKLPDNSAVPPSGVLCAGFHFTPLLGWLNDPNGLVYYNGEFHLFYQHHPDDSVWGPMHWGHAVSSDLVHWQHLPIALAPDELGNIYSGSAVIDWHNTAGFGREAMIAFFTHHDPRDASESQSLAFSLDSGRTWTKYAGNPVIPIPAHRTDFRDPKVFWFSESGDQGHWVMLLAASKEIQFFTSTDLISWQPSGSFTSEQDARVGVWETPDLFQVPLNDGSGLRWILTVGVGDGAPAGGSGMRYFTGFFDGQVFSTEKAGDQSFWADWGADFYAAQSWNGLTTGQHGRDRRVWLAWFNNWRYANSIPFCRTRGMMTLPREIQLAGTAEGVRLIQEPVAELEVLRQHESIYREQTIRPAQPFIPVETGDLLEIIAEFQIKSGSELAQFGIRLRTGGEEETIVGYRPQDQILFVDRTRSGLTDFSDDFPRCHEAQMALMDDRVRLQLFLDRQSIELFANNGATVMSELIFPTQLPYRLELFAVGDMVMMRHLAIYTLTAAQDLMT